MICKKENPAFWIHNTGYKIVPFLALDYSWFKTSLIQFKLKNSPQIPAYHPNKKLYKKKKKIQHFGSTIPGTKLSPFQPWTILGSRLHYFNSSLKTAHKFQHTTQTRNDTEKKSSISDPQYQVQNCPLFSLGLFLVQDFSTSIQA